MAEASLFVLDLDYDNYVANTDPMLSHINVGTGEDISIRELAVLVAEITGFDGCITCHTSKPAGTMRKLMGFSRLRSMGWQAKIALRQGIETTYAWYLDKPELIRA